MVAVVEGDLEVLTGEVEEQEEGWNEVVDLEVDGAGEDLVVVAAAVMTETETKVDLEVDEEEVGVVEEVDLTILVEVEGEISEKEAVVDMAEEVEILIMTEMDSVAKEKVLTPPESLEAEEGVDLVVGGAVEEVVEAATEAEIMALKSTVVAASMVQVEVHVSEVVRLLAEEGIKIFINASIFFVGIKKNSVSHYLRGNQFLLKINNP